jgi:carbonic anhydrase/acetyltransferase-like protein (isoleucine patch superfamily)
MGNPARQTRPLTGKEMTFFNYTAKRYVDLAAAYLQESG